MVFASPWSVQKSVEKLKLKSQSWTGVRWTAPCWRGPSYRSNWQRFCWNLDRNPFHWGRYRSYDLSHSSNQEWSTIASVSHDRTRREDWKLPNEQSPFIVMATLHGTADDYGASHIRAITAIGGNFYMDDYFDSGCKGWWRKVSVKETLTLPRGYRIHGKISVRGRRDKWSNGLIRERRKPQSPRIRLEERWRIHVPTREHQRNSKHRKRYTKQGSGNVRAPWVNCTNDDQG